MKRMFGLLAYCLFCLSFICCTNLSNTVNQSESENATQVEDILKDKKESKIETITLKNGELTTIDIVQERNISLYNDGGGHFIDDLPKVRDFIWRHWEERKRGYIRVTFYSLEGYASTSHIFIEPKADERWRITWQIVRAHDLLYKHSDIITVEKVNLTNTGNKMDSYRLMFKDKDGNLVFEEEF